MMDELKPAQPQSLGERLLGLMYGGTDAESEYYKRQAREAELRRMEQKAFEDQGGGLEAQIPGGNPEVPTPLDALVGALMSMGGVPPSVARSGTAPTVPAPRPAQKNSLIASEPEWMSSAPGGRTRQTRIETPDGFVIEPPDKIEGIPIYRVGKKTSSGIEWFEGANSLREAKSRLKQAQSQPSPPPENMAPYNSPEDLATGASQRIISAIMEKQNRANASPPPASPIMDALIEASKRREIRIPTEAKLLGVSENEVRSAINSLRKEGKLYESTSSKKSYWGSTHAGYRSLAEKNSSLPPEPAAASKDFSNEIREKIGAAKSSPLEVRMAADKSGKFTHDSRKWSEELEDSDFVNLKKVNLNEMPEGTVIQVRHFSKDASGKYADAADDVFLKKTSGGWTPEGND